MAKRTQQSLVPIERIASAIYLIRGEKVMLDYDLADLYRVETRALVQAVKRNIERFPTHFMFQLSEEEFEYWRSQIVISNPSAKMGLRRPPYAFTERGVAMLSSVLKSKQAIQINIAIMDTFVRLREMLSTNKELARKVEKHDKEIVVLYDQLKKLLDPPKSSKKQIGYLRHRE
ncbi:MAG: ORF6N domain-containing protein [Nitrospirae bacterium]|nr:ORF6N domain-containing protein [Nitrospirota bacterium]MDA1304273.1 ORF6N domain-containing protein [Nitrospirota bacterium]